MNGGGLRVLPKCHCSTTDLPKKQRPRTVTKILNLDDLETTVERAIKIGGVEHKMKPFTVEAFINQMKEIEQIGDQDPTGSEMYATSLRMIMRAFPTLTNDIVQNMNTFQVDAIYGFLKDKTEDAVEEASASGNSEGEV